MITMKYTNTFVIIDGNAIIHRAYHALPPLTAKDGTIVNAVFGFSSMLLKVLNDLKPTHIAVSFDLAEKTFRDNIYVEYKATRVKGDQELYDQIPLVHSVVEAFNIPIYTKSGFEADDVIGTIAQKQKNAAKKDTKIIIVTGDKDLLQLVDGNMVEVYLLRKGMSDFVLFDEKKVRETYGFMPDCVPDYKALMGDPSDNIPGVKGVGKKTAEKLIQQFETIESLYRSLKKNREAFLSTYKKSITEKLEQDKENAILSKTLATIVTNVTGLRFSFTDCLAHEFDAEEVKKLFQKFEFFSLIQRIPGVTLAPKKEKKENKKQKKHTYSVVKNAEDITLFLTDIKKQSHVVCKEILAGDDVLTNPLLGFVCITKEHAYFVDIAHCLQKEREKIYAIFSDPKLVLIGHDIKQLLKACIVSGIPVTNTLFDCMVASYITNESTRSHDLKNIVLRELRIELPTGSNQSTLFGVDPKIIATEYAHLLVLYEKYIKVLKKQKQDSLFYDMEMPLVLVLADMECVGVGVDTVKLAMLSKEVHATINLLTKKIHKLAGKVFNIASSVQLRDVLFLTLALPTKGIKKGKTGYSTAASELEKLREEHSIIPLIEEYREVVKLQNTYIDVLPKLVHKKTKRIHTSFNQTITATGRLSSSDPNLQNIPIRTTMGRRTREAFVAKKGNTLIAADYSQFELRIVASLAKDKKLIDIFTKGEDVHKATAAAINGVSIEKVTKEMRRAAKEVNFGVLYGMGSFGLATRANIPVWQAKQFIDSYFTSFKHVKKWIDKTIDFAVKHGYVETLFGRRRQIPELQSANRQLKNAGERMAINMPVQGTQADIIKLAMIQLQKKIANDPDISLILQVHDELIFEVKKGKEEVYAKMIKKYMREVVDLLVPIEVDVAIGRSWGKLK
ncbi:MAG: DNA polymerase I [Candidatus Magasanikbacteria bacterium]|nr:DNA polymerase I [Candidatus Magasanikbacteria bacterium]